jgi:hypothetical protein
MHRLPVARNENIVVQNAGKELLVYDLLTNKAYCLNETSKIVFEACDGKTSFDELRSRYKLTDDYVYFALDELRRENLIAGDYVSTFNGVSRREAIRRVGLASLIALPVISSLLAPRAAHAQSLFPLLAACTQSVQCASSACGNTLVGGDRCCVVVNDSGCTTNAKCCTTGGGTTSTCRTDGTCCLDNGSVCVISSECCSGNCNRNSVRCEPQVP